MLFPNAGVVVDPTLLILLGVIVGTLGGFFGVGGGFLITGGLLVFGVPPLFAVGTGLTLIMGSLTGQPEGKSGLCGILHRPTS